MFSFTKDPWVVELEKILIQKIQNGFILLLTKCVKPSSNLSVLGELEETAPPQKWERFTWTSLNTETHLSMGFGKFHSGEIRRYFYGWSYRQTTRKDLTLKLRSSPLPIQMSCATVFLWKHYSLHSFWPLLYFLEALGQATVRRLRVSNAMYDTHYRRCICNKFFCYAVSIKHGVFY